MSDCSFTHHVKSFDFISTQCAAKPSSKRSAGATHIPHSGPEDRCLWPSDPKTVSHSPYQSVLAYRCGREKKSDVWPSAVARRVTALRRTLSMVQAADDTRARFSDRECNWSRLVLLPLLLL